MIAKEDEAWLAAKENPVTETGRGVLEERLNDLGGLVRRYPGELVDALLRICRRRNTALYLVGGTVRDWLLGRNPHDLDLTVATGAELFCRELICELGGGTFVRLGTPEEEAARVVWRGQDVDISSFRGNAMTIEEDLVLRDFTINALAVELSRLPAEGRTALVDPLHGLRDLREARLRHCPRAFADDFLRLLRTYRFMATLGFAAEDGTVREITENAWAIQLVAAERVRYELDLIMQSERAALVLRRMHEHGLLRPLLPELYAGLGIEQPSFHHLDVFFHSLQTLSEMEGLLAAAGSVYPSEADEVIGYLADMRARVCLKWAALLHDMGKPAARAPAKDEGDRVTFYGHDEIGRRQFDGLARRMRWSNAERERTGHLIAMHMHPFHLCNVRRDRELSTRAAVKLCRRAGDELPGLFLLAMADSLASRGELKPEHMEQELAALYNEVMTIHRQHIGPALSAPPLLGGRELIEHFGLTPGPVFSVILDELLLLQAEGAVTTREEALAWVSRFLQDGEIRT